MDKQRMESMDLIEANIKKVGELFPNVITEVMEEIRCENGEYRKVIKKAVDFEALKQELSYNIVEGDRERYQFTWPGKKEAILLANTPTDKILRPVMEDSVDWGKTQNIYIEGDNLEVLKILQKSYYGKVKCIYIDPPYNTGKKFIYKDDFRQAPREYLQESGRKDEDDSEYMGRFHSDWLSMMYPRLKLARNILRDDGVIYISIDDNEVNNVKKICDEIFGENNFLATIPVLSNPRGRQSSRFIAPAHEYLVVYAKDISFCTINGLPLSEEEKKQYNRQDEKGIYREIGLRLRGGRARAAESPTLFFPIYYSESEDDFYTERKHQDDYEIIPRFKDGTLGTWRWSRDKINKDKEFLTVRRVRDKNGGYKYDVFQKDYLSPEKTRKVKSLWYEKEINYDRSNDELKELLGSGIFDYAKPLYLLNKILTMAAGKDDIVMDFFSGSATTAHAVMELNACDGGGRKYIMVQIPEETSKDSEAYKAGYKDICQIGKERIRKAAKKIREATGASIDYGFRVFKVSSQDMNDQPVGNDFLVQAMLQNGLELSLPLEKILEMLFHNIG